MKLFRSSFKTLIEAKYLHISFAKIDGFIIIYDGNRCLTLFGSEIFGANRIKYLIGLKGGIMYVFSLCYPKIKAGSNDSLTLEKILT